MRWLIACLPLIAAGCGSLNPALNTAGHALVPGYTTAATVKHHQEQIETRRVMEVRAQNVNGGAQAEILINPVGIWEAYKEGGIGAILGTLWDVAKLGGWVAGLQAISDATDDEPDPFVPDGERGQEIIAKGGGKATLRTAGSCSKARVIAIGQGSESICSESVSADNINASNNP